MSGILTSNSAKVIISLSLFCFVRISAASTFPRTTVINLPRHASRREHTINELSSKNVKFSWVEAIDGMNMTQSELSGNATTLARWFMTLGMIGCFLSHRRCWEQCVRPRKALLVFEDDVILAPNFQKNVTVAISRCNEPDLVEKWDVLLLAVQWDVSILIKNMISILLPLLLEGNISSTEKLLPFIRVPMYPYGMHAYYIITPRGASKFFNACPRSSFHAYYVMRDMERKKLVLCIRGTLSPRDILTDLRCTAHNVVAFDEEDKKQDDVDVDPFRATNNGL
eukprot:scaffold411130_cov47-Attheya_sp.AAC.2